MTVGRGGLAEIRAFLERRRGRGAVAGQMERGAAQEQADRAPLAVLGLALAGAPGHVSHPADVMATQRRLDHGEPRGQRARAVGRAPVDGRCRRSGEMARFGHVPGGQEAVRARERERRVTGELLATEGGQPFLNELVASLADVGHDPRRQQISRAHRVVRVHGMSDRVVQISVPLKPGARAIMERTNVLGADAPQFRTERVAKQPVPSETFVSAVERAQERAGLCQAAQHQRGPAPLKHGVAYRPRELVEHRRPDDELGHISWQPGQNLVAEVLGQTMIIAAQTGDCGAHVGLGA